MRFSLATVVSAALLALAGPSAWADTPGWYIGAGGGWSDLEKMTNNNTSIGYDNGFLVSGFAGYDFGTLRAEGEVGYRHHDVHSLSTGGVGLNNPGGAANALSFMANGIYSFFPKSILTPYLGAGIGVARLTLDGVSAAGTSIVNSNADTEFAYQGIAGVSYAVSRSVSLNLDYRYFATTDPTFQRTAAGGGGSFTPEYHTHNVLLSLTYHFGAPAPAPAPVPAAAPAPAPAPAVAAPAPVAPVPPAAQRIFIVFFDFDKDTLTPEGTKVVEQAAATVKAGGTARLDVTGYTDMAGTAKYNLALSKRRADRVRALMVKLGVPVDAITETARGKENPRVPTADGVREPQNRRVEIVIP